ncbi:hypothetical protein HDU78_002152 [Chytriomyces hyalinus]|nr:hypothetical protein HDU78_002152 [Chytriomyces hyalinus]
MARLVPVNVVERIGQHLRDSDDRRSVVECARVTRRWTEGMLRALYKCPRLVQHDSFEALLAVLGATVPGSRGLVGYGKDQVVGLDSSGGDGSNQAITYASLVAELDLCGAAADNVYIGDLDGALALCSNLRILRLGSVFHMSNMIVQSVATHCLNLLQLELPGCPVSDAFVPLLAKTCAKLLRFDAAFTNLSVGSLVPLVSFASSLLELDLSECREPDPNLNLSAKDLRRPLKFLNLRNTQISDSLLTFTISNCPVLEILVLESCSKLSDASITLLFSFCPQLRSVDLSFCDSLTDTSLAAIPATTKLEELYLSGLDLISAYAVHALVRRLRFNTSNLAGVEKSASTLELLVLDGCEQIVGSFIKGFAAVGDDLECELEKDGLLRLAAVPLEGEAEQENGNVPSVTSPTIAAGVLSPVVQMQSMMSDLKVEVSYADREMHVLRNKGESKYVGNVAGKASVMSPQPEPARMQQPHPHDQHQRSHEDAEYRALADSVAASGSVAQRRASKTLRHRKSLLGLSSRQEQEDSEEVHEAAKLERVEKIKEKRRSGGAGNFFGAGGAGGIHSTSSSGPARTSFIGGSGSGPSLSTLDLHERFLAAASIPRPASEIDNTASSSGSLPRTHSDPVSFGSSAEASKAAFLAAAAAKGLKISAPDASDGGPRLIKKRPSSILRANVAEFVPLSPPTANSAMDEEPAYVAPVNNDSKVNRRISVGVPAGPPPPDSRLAAWNGIGSSASPMGSGSSPSMTPGYLPGSSPLAAPPVQQIVTPTGESGVLLFSGRKSARMSVNRDSLPPMNGFAQQPSDGGVASVERNDSGNAAGEESPIVIASGRRRTRGTSIVDESKAVSAAIQVATGIPQRSSPPPPQAAALPLWATAPAAPPAVAPTGPWGTDPTVWNNPAQLTSASSTWSSNGPQQQTGFADPWAGSRAAALPAPSGPGVGMGEPATSVLGPAPVINSMDPWAAAPASAANAVTPPSAVVNAAAAAAAVNPSMAQPGPASVQSWQQQQQQQQQPKMIPQRPTVPSSRFGGVGTISNIMSTPAGLLANPAGLGARGAAPQMQHGYQQQQQVLSGNHGEGGSGGGFVYSAQNRGRLLLKLKIETKIGGEQMLAVHEYDDPQQLATEFVNYWELQAFKDPLVRLIAVRKTNVLRNRGAMNV